MPFSRKRGDNSLNDLRKEHETAVANWNDNWNYFCVGLTIYADFEEFAKRLEQILQRRFVRAGGLIKYCLATSDESRLAQLEKGSGGVLNSISGETFNFCRDLQNLIRAKEKAAYADPERD